jgi:2-polyprenyl-3-methyl-5-hydroxy-6-metoxy-1,4-benzoquinol methylase
MFDMLVNMLNKPVLWQRSFEPFWDDEHISKGMLKAHLDPDSDLASRKHEYIDRSVNWLAGFLSSCNRILDLGCGPGLYTKRFSDMGFDVTGVDTSRRSIEYAKCRDTKTTYSHSNYLENEFAGMFDIALMIYCDYAALTLSERQKLLKKV